MTTATLDSIYRLQLAAEACAQEARDSSVPAMLRRIEARAAQGLRRSLRALGAVA